MCCFEDMGLDHCGECYEFPCRKYVAKLPGSHPDDARFEYRREAVDNLGRVQEVGAAMWLEEQDARWRCPDCGGRVVFWRYVCAECGREHAPK